MISEVQPPDCETVTACHLHPGSPRKLTQGLGGLDDLLQASPWGRRRGPQRDPKRTLLKLILTVGLGPKPCSARTLFLTAQVPRCLPSAARDLAHRFAPGCGQGARHGERPTDGCWLAASCASERRRVTAAMHTAFLIWGQAALRQLCPHGRCWVPGYAGHRPSAGCVMGPHHRDTVSREKKSHVKPSSHLCQMSVKQTTDQSHTFCPGGPDARSA